MSKKSIMALALALVFPIVLAACSPAEVDNTRKTVEVTNANLASVETDGTLFFYPSYYQESTIEGYRKGFSSTQLNELGGSNNIGTTLVQSSGSGKTNQGGCEEVAQQTADGLEQALSSIAGVEVSASVEKAEARTNGDIQECYVLIPYQLNGATMYNEQRQVWTSGKEDENIYGISLTYSATSAESEINDLKDALEAFRLL